MNKQAKTYLKEVSMCFFFRNIRNAALATVAGFSFASVAWAAETNLAGETAESSAPATEIPAAPKAAPAEAAAPEAPAVSEEKASEAAPAEAAAPEAPVASEEKALDSATAGTMPASESAALAAETRLDREMTAKDADELQRLAVTSYQEGEYEEAVDLLLKALDILQPKDPEVLLSQQDTEKIETLKRMIAKAYYYWAQKLFLEAERSANSGKYEEAIKKCQSAKEIYPLSSDIMDEAIDRYTKMKTSADYKQATSLEAASEDYKVREHNIARLLRQGKTFYNNKLWDNAAKKFNEVIALDPYNETAIDFLRRIYMHRYHVGELRRDGKMIDYNGRVVWNAIAPVMVDSEVEEEATETEGPIIGDATSNIRRKLDSIMVGPMDFEDAPLADVIQYLKRASKDNDVDRIGVNFVLRSNSGIPIADDSSSAYENADSGDGSDAGSWDDSGEDSGENADAGSDAESWDDSGDGSDSESWDDSGEDSGDGSDSESGDAASFDTAPTSLEHATVTIGIDQKGPLSEAIKKICGAAQVQYRIEEYAVVIAPKNVPLDEFKLSSFPLGPNLIDGTDTNEPEKIKSYFEERGVPFAAGSSVFYDRDSNKLYVYNTQEALASIDTIIKEIDDEIRQVLVHVKFVEVRLDDMQELGFQYVISRPSPRPQSEYGNTFGEPLWVVDTFGGVTEEPGASGWIWQANGHYTVITRDPTAETTALGNATITNWTNGMLSGEIQDGGTITMPANSGTYYFYPYMNGGVEAQMQKLYGSATTFDKNDPIVRNATTDYQAYGLTSARNDTMFNWNRQSYGGFNIDASVNALDQANSYDILSSPRVATMNQETATIKMITRKYYPSSWSEAELQTVNGYNGTTPVFSPSIPDFNDDPKEEGIILEITPTVESDNYTISLDVAPVIQEFEGWTDYSYDIPWGDCGTLYPNTLKMPIIQLRTVRTHIKSYDNETIVLGGIIQDRMDAIEDQYPILGDIPLVGRLFQTIGKKNEKKNLLMFLTSHLIHPDGSLVRMDQNGSGRGLPNNQ